MLGGRRSVGPLKRTAAPKNDVLCLRLQRVLGRHMKVKMMTTVFGSTLPILNEQREITEFSLAGSNNRFRAWSPYMCVR
jgi:hypothetical protein